MLIFKKNFLFLAIFSLTAIFSPEFIQASFWDTIRAWVTINPLEVIVSASSEVEINKVFQVEARVINKGGEKIENTKAEIFLPLEIVLIGKDPIQEIKVILGKKEKKVSWSVKGEQIGSYFILVKASGELKGELISAEDGTMTEAKESLPRGRAQGWLQNLFDFFLKRFTL